MNPSDASDTGDELLILGKIAGLFGVKGWVKVFSHTDPRENIVGYSPWYLRKGGGEWTPVKVKSGRRHGKSVVALLEGIEDRDGAVALQGYDIAVHRSQLPAPADGEFYWTDLIGLTVSTESGVELGRVDHLLETGANDVLVVRGERERLIPFLYGDVVKTVDLAQRCMVVDWDPDF